MGDDADYFIEMQEEEKRMNQAYQDANSRRDIKALITWTDGYEDELWDWSPAARVNGVFSRLHKSLKIGRDYFLVHGLPDFLEDEFDEDLDSISNDEFNRNLIIKLKTFSVDSEKDALCEILVLSHKDKALLQSEAERYQKEAKSLKEKMIPEMFGEMISHMESEPKQKIFIFARVI